jgi:hypothetical protein
MFRLSVGELACFGPHGLHTRQAGHGKREALPHSFPISLPLGARGDLLSADNRKYSLGSSSMLVTFVDGAGLEGSSHESNSRGKRIQTRGDTIRTNLSVLALLMTMQFSSTLASVSFTLGDTTDIQSTFTDTISIWVSTPNCRRS